MNLTVPRIVFSLMVMALPAACASPHSHFYTLGSTPEKPLKQAFSANIAVGPVTIPESVNRPEMVLRVGPNRVAIDEFNRWAAPLQAEIQRVVMENLARLLGTPRVTRYPQGAIGPPGFRVEIEVLRFELTPADAAFLDAVWTVHGKKGEESRTGRTSLSEPVSGGSYDALVAAQSRALGTLSRDLAEAILALERSAG